MLCFEIKSKHAQSWSNDAIANKRQSTMCGHQWYRKYCNQVKQSEWCWHEMYWNYAAAYINMSSWQLWSRMLYTLTTTWAGERCADTYTFCWVKFCSWRTVESETRDVSRCRWLNERVTVISTHSSVEPATAPALTRRICRDCKTAHDNS